MKMEANRFLVSGLLNVETSCPVEQFPLPYTPVHFEFGTISLRPSGVGLNLAAALHQLGNQVQLCGLVGNDPGADLVINDLTSRGLATDDVLRELGATPCSVVLFDPSGRRSCITDLSDIQQARYPSDRLRHGIEACDWALLCNLDLNRVALEWAGEIGRPIATDVHALDDFADPYNADFMAAAEVLFCSHERLPDSPEATARELLRRYRPGVLVIGMGSAGALLATPDGAIRSFKAEPTRPVVNTVGAGDALAAAFLHTYASTGDAGESLRRAMWFASWKIGDASASTGFPSPERWSQLHS